MGILSRILSKTTIPISGTANGDIISSMFDQTSDMMTYTDQMRSGYKANPYVYRASNLVASTISGISPVLMDRDGNEIDLPNHYVTGLLEHPAPNITWRQMMYEVVMDRMLNGNAFIHNVSVRGHTKELDLYHGKNVDYTPSGDIRAPVRIWTVNTGTGSINILPEDMIHICGFTGDNDVLGVSPLQSASYSINQQNNARKWNNSLTKNGAKPSTVVQTPKAMNDAKFKEFSERMHRLFQGSDNAGKMMILDDGKTVQQLGFSPLDMDYSSGMTVSAREISLALGVPPELVGDSANKTYSNAQEANKEVIDHTIKPMMDEIYDAISMAVIHDDPQIARIGYDQEPLAKMRGDLPTMITAAQGASFLTVNEKRAMLSYGSVEGGDVVLQPMGQVPVAELSVELPDVSDNSGGEDADI